MATESNPPLSLDKTAVKRQERPHWVLDDAVYSISALLLSVIVMHSIWTLIIRPRAEAVLAQRITVTNKDVKHQVIQLRSVYVILKDHEQELCVTLCMWSLLLLGRQAWITNKDRKLLDKDYVRIGEAQVVLPEDARVERRRGKSRGRDEDHVVDLGRREQRVLEHGAGHAQRQVEGVLDVEIVLLAEGVLVFEPFERHADVARSDRRVVEHGEETRVLEDAPGELADFVLAVDVSGNSGCQGQDAGCHEPSVRHGAPGRQQKRGEA